MLSIILYFRVVCYCFTQAIGGLGTKMLERSKFLREKLEEEIRITLHDATGIQNKVELSKMITTHQNELKSSVFHDLTELEKQRVVDKYGVSGVTHWKQAKG